MCVGVRGSAAVGALLLMAPHCSLSGPLSVLSLSQPVYGPPLFHRAPQLDLCVGLEPSSGYKLCWNDSCQELCCQTPAAFSL